MNVYPRKPLEVFPTKLPWGKPWEVVVRLPSWCTDTEIAEHFYPAERLDTLLAAVEEHADSCGGTYGRPDEVCELCAAFRAFREQDVTA